jgi:asparagine synthase (glutamine-hydrolysing)
MDWMRRYFNHFAAVPEKDWLKVFEAREVISRRKAWEIFHEGVDSSPAPDPATRLMHWDKRTYLPGLFSQDDRMSMANSLESRVPLADPRIVRFAFHIPFEWKFRAGASKWILRQAVADVIPERVLNRRKVGFDTPAEAWMKGRHLSWVRETLTGSSTRSRGLFNIHGVEHLLSRPDHPRWFPVIWKLLCIEVWAQQFLDGDGLRPVLNDVEEGRHAA